MDIEKPGKVGKPIDPTSIKAYLESKKLGWEIDGPFYTTLPIPKAKYIERCVEYVEILTHHLLKTVIIKDQFDEDHSARRAFERENPEIGTFSSKYSKLGGNILFRALIAMEEITEKVGKIYPPIAKKLTAIAKLPEISQEFARYTQMTFEEKVIFARKLDDIIYKFLEVLAR